MEDRKESEIKIHAQKNNSIFPPINTITLQNESADEFIEDNKARHRGPISQMWQTLGEMGTDAFSSRAATDDKTRPKTLGQEIGY